jgi:hypothetical protein
MSEIFARSDTRDHSIDICSCVLLNNILIKYESITSEKQPLFQKLMVNSKRSESTFLSININTIKHRSSI